jgi:hypothetical protein
MAPRKNVNEKVEAARCVGYWSQKILHLLQEAATQLAHTIRYLLPLCTSCIGQHIHALKRSQLQCSTVNHQQTHHVDSYCAPIMYQGAQGCSKRCSSEEGFKGCRGRLLASCWRGIQNKGVCWLLLRKRVRHNTIGASASRSVPSHVEWARQQGAGAN